MPDFLYPLPCASTATALPHNVVGESPAGFAASDVVCCAVALLASTVLVLLACSFIGEFHLSGRMQSFSRMEGENVTHAVGVQGERSWRSVLLSLLLYVPFVCSAGLLGIYFTMLGFGLSAGFGFVIGIGLAVLFMMVKRTLYLLVGYVFFAPWKMKIWSESLGLVYFLSGLALMVLSGAALLHIPSSGIGKEYVIPLTITILLTNPFVMGYRAWKVFFQAGKNYLGTFLYFCTLEFMPLTILWCIAVRLFPVPA